MSVKVRKKKIDLAVHSSARFYEFNDRTLKAYLTSYNNVVDLLFVDDISNVPLTVYYKEWEDFSEILEAACMGEDSSYDVSHRHNAFVTRSMDFQSLQSIERVNTPRRISMPIKIWQKVATDLKSLDIVLPATEVFSEWDELPTREGAKLFSADSKKILPLSRSLFSPRTIPS
jgi:hypothetical protein